MLYLIPMNCHYILAYRKEVRDPITSRFTHVTYTLDNEPSRSTQPVVYFHGERADWSSVVGKAIKEQLVLGMFTKLHNRSPSFGLPWDRRFDPQKIEEWWTIFLLPRNNKNASWAIYYTKEAMTKVAEYPGEKVTLHE